MLTYLNFQKPRNLLTLLKNKETGLEGREGTIKTNFLMSLRHQVVIMGRKCRSFALTCLGVWPARGWGGHFEVFGNEGTQRCYFQSMMGWYLELGFPGAL